MAYAVDGSKPASQDQQKALAAELAKKLRECKSVKEIRRLLTTKSTDSSITPVWGQINYTVWSDVYICPECAHEVVFWEAAVDKAAGKVNNEFSCPNCQVLLSKRNMDRVWITKLDKSIGQTIREIKQVPVLINYSIGKKRYEKQPDVFDQLLIEKIENFNIPFWFPTNVIPKGDKTGEPIRIGITHVHHFYSKRNLWVLSALRSCIDTNIYMPWFTSSLTWVGKENRLHLGNYFGGGGGVITSLRGTWYIASLPVETNVLERFTLRKRTQKVREGVKKDFLTTETLSATRISATSNSIDYIFTDPPFGGNLMYSELNILWEAWLKVSTNKKPEAVQNKTQGKGLPDYQRIMTECFSEYARVLKPGRWMTVEFHNSKNSVWNSIQEALQASRFIIADVRTLDKKKGSFNQATVAGAVKQDLIISAYKPSQGLEENFQLQAGTDKGVWEFLRSHLKQLPVFAIQGEAAEAIAERQNYLLFDRMIAFHVQRGVSVPMSAAEFYQGLAQRFDERDGMYFLPEQAAEYDRKRRTVKQFRQLSLMVIDEASAIQWLKQQLSRKPQTFQELHPQFMKEIGGWQKHEKMLELSDLLEQNFLIYSEGSPIPAQIVSWMKQSEEMRSIIAEETEVGRLREDQGALHIEQTTPQISKLISRARSRWYVPNPHRAADLEKLREKSLLKEFEEYRQFKGRKMKQFRLEAVRAGFKKAWQDRDYQTIINIAEKIPEKVLQEDPKLLMWYDQAVTRVGN